MGLFDRRRICFTIPRKQYEIISFLIDTCEEENKNFDPDRFFERILGEWIDKNWKPIMRQIAYSGKKTKQKSK